MSIRPIPAYYCCYLLQSSSKRAIYIGSTPHPARRLAQHNGGIEKGGAKRTSWKAYRPWEMTCIIEGFPSRIAALQFEWAWQNPHITKKIDDDHRLYRPLKSKKGKLQRKSCKPKLSFSGQLKVLDILFRVSSFSRMPLRIRVFSQDVYRKWHGTIRQLDNDERIILDPKQGEDHAEEAGELSKQDLAKRKRAAIGQGGVEGVDVGYGRISRHVERKHALVSSARSMTCCIGCNAISHMACLAAHYLAQEGVNESSIPVNGSCPECDTGTPWIEVVKEISIRERGSRSVQSSQDVTYAYKEIDSDSSMHSADEEVYAFDDCEINDVNKSMDRKFASDFRGEDIHVSISTLTAQHRLKTVEAEEMAYSVKKAPNINSAVIEDSDWEETDLLA